MAALTADFKPDKLGAEDLVFPGLLKYPVEAATSIYGGAMVGVNAAGNAVPASANSALKIVGRAERQTLNLATGGTVSPDGIANGNAGSIKVTVRQGVFYYNVNADSTIDGTRLYANVFASDDNTVSLSDAGGTRPYVGYVVDAAIATSMKGSTSVVGVFLGQANAYAVNPLLAVASGGYRARAVVTSLAAYTGSGTQTLTASVNGAWAAQDGVAAAVNDVVFIQAGTTNLTAALDSGPWQITSLGGASAKWTLARPDWWTNGAVMPLGAKVTIDGEGTLWAGTAWTSYATQGSAVVGTNDPSFYVDQVTQQVTLVASASTITNVGIRSAAKVGMSFVYTGTGAIVGTVGFGLTAAATAGYIGTSSIPIAALAAGMGKNGTTDVSVVNVTIINNA